jgi:uncharacterized membrane protein
MFYNFVDIPLWIPWKPDKFPYAFPLSCRASYGVTVMVTALHYQLNSFVHMKYTFVCGMIRKQKVLLLLCPL